MDGTTQTGGFIDRLDWVDDRIALLDTEAIKQAIPHRYPFLMIDRVQDMVREVSAIGIKNVTVNEPYFQGHFPGHPVMPGVLVIEAMAQTGAVLVICSMGAVVRGRPVYFMTIEQAKFRRPVLPGDQLRLTVTREQRRGPVWKFRGIGHVDGQVVAETFITAMVHLKR